MHILLERYCQRNKITIKRMVRLRLSATPVHEIDERVSERECSEPNVSRSTVFIESVPDILERELPVVIKEWLCRVEQEPDLMCVSMNSEDRTGHLPKLLHAVISRLRLTAGMKAP